MAQDLAPLRIPRWWTSEEVASLLRVSRRTIRRWIKAGELEGIKRITYSHVGPRPYRWVRYFVSGPALNRYLKAQEAKAAEARASATGTDKKRSQRSHRSATKGTRPLLDASET